MLRIVERNALRKVCSSGRHLATPEQGCSQCVVCLQEQRGVWHALCQGEELLP